MAKLPRLTFRFSGREQAVFFAMIVLTIVALVSTAISHLRTTETMLEIANSNRVWVDHLDLLSDLEVRAGDVNAPGNNVFDSRDVSLERNRFGELQAQFDLELAKLQQTVAMSVSNWGISADQEALKAVEKIEARMAASTEAIFLQFESGDLAGSARTMAEMDKHYADLRAQLQQIRLKWTDVKRGYADQQMAVIGVLKNVNAAVMVVNLLFILGLILSGYRIFKRVRESEQALIEARNGAIHAGQVKARFIANISHEIRTPMNGIMGMTRLLSDERLRPEAAHYVEKIKTCGATLLGLINDVLLFSKMESEQVSLDIRPFDVHKAVKDVSELLSVAAREKGLSLSCRLDASLPRYLMGDDMRVRQVVTNLVNNAIKFTNRGSVVVEGAATAVEGNLYDVYLAVKDSGIGISREAQSKLFQAFYQVRDQRASGPVEGTGLGLAICKAICTAMGGRIGVQSEIGRGTTFTVDFRSGGVEGVPAVSPEGVSHIEAGLGGRLPLRILVVEDNPTNQLVTVEFLAKLGYGVDVAADGQKALEMVEGRQYDLIFMDCRMPIMDGFESTKRIRQAPLNQHRPAIIALTASAFEDDYTRCLAVGMDDVLAKPLDLHMLQQVLVKWGGHRGVDAPVHEKAAISSEGEVSGGPVEVAVLLEEFAGMERGLASGLESFLRDAPNMLRRIQDALEAGDADGLCDAAHTLKGAVALFRSPSIVSLCRTIEQFAREGSLDRAAEPSRALALELERARGALALLKVQCLTIASEHQVGR
jgi:signal transduction histidine kinase/HPt (histidine-containing phosphotransfer) domain-containing protein/ActR/RegA family two-component response regulator